MLCLKCEAYTITFDITVLLVISMKRILIWWLLLVTRCKCTAGHGSCIVQLIV